MPYSLPVDNRVYCCCGGERTVHVMEGRYCWCQRCGMLMIYERSLDHPAGPGSRWIYNHQNTPSIPARDLVETQAVGETGTAAAEEDA